MPATRSLARDISQGWQTFGPLFHDLHLMFDELAKDVLETVDEFAERIRMIGPNIENVQLKQSQEAAKIDSSWADQSMRDMIEEAAANLRGK
jgi:starvation-inducible DNA-binding protein